MIGNYIITSDGKILNKKGQEIKKYINKGRWIVPLVINGKNATFIVARLVYKLHNPNWDLGSSEVICYKDNDPLNIKYENLYLKTKKETAFRKLSDKDYAKIIQMYDNKEMSMKQLGNYFNVSKSAIQNVLKLDKHGLL